MLWLLLSSPALACGGFFCSQVPIDQAEERIVFTVDPVANETEVHVQLRYDGPPTLFSWVLPVPSVPSLKLSTDQLFTSIDNRTRPRFDYTTEYLGDCGGETGGDSAWGSSESGSSADTASGGGGPGVIVIAEQEVGAYATVTLSASDPLALEAWLVSNSYTLPPNFVAVVTPYVMNGAYFVAVKLQNGADTGAIEPLAFTYQGSEPMIPIILTSIAAVEDMPVELWMLGPSRGVPLNYLHVTVSDAAIDWERRGANYRDLIRQAADEAGGQAFSTDMAGPSDLLDRLLWYPGRFSVPYWLCQRGDSGGGDSADDTDLDTDAPVCAEDIPGCEGECVLATLEDDPVSFIGTIAEWNLPLDTTLLDILQTCFPMPAGLPAWVTPSNFYSFIESYERYWRGQPLDAVACAAMVEERILAPLQAAQEMLDSQPYLTRMTSSMSASEMTVDPYFSFNPDLPDVSPVRHATLTIDCTTVQSEEDAPRWWTYADGSVLVDVPPSQRDELEAGPVDQIAAERVEMMGRSGPPILVDDRSADIEALADARRQAVDALRPAPGETGQPDSDEDSDPDTDSETVVPVETDAETDVVAETDLPVETDPETDLVVETDTEPVETGGETDLAAETDSEDLETDTDLAETDGETDRPIETDLPADSDETELPADTDDPEPEETDTPAIVDDVPTNAKDCGGCSHSAPTAAWMFLLWPLLRRRR